jgi:hypothetical protein
MKNKLEKLLYRKNVLEYTLRQYEKGAQVYSEYCELLKSKIKDKDDSFENIKYKKELIDNKIHAANYITSYKNSLAEYKDYLIPEIEQEKTKNDNEIEFLDFEKNTKDLAEYELFGKTTPKAPNVEIPNIIKDIEDHIELLTELKHSIYKKLKTTKDDYEIANLKIQMYNTINHEKTLRKRLNERNEYYFETFLPKYEVELEQAKNVLPLYIDIAKEIIDLGIDHRLTMLLSEYEKHKEEEENLWLFFTALKTRLKNIKEELIKQPTKPKLKLFKTII